jgi:hypothetical protein
MAAETDGLNVDGIAAGGLGRTPGPRHPPAAAQAAVGSADQAPVEAGCRTYGDHVELPGGRQLLRLLSRRQTWVLTSRRQPITARPAANISHGTSTTRSAAVKLASFATGATGLARQLSGEHAETHDR